MRIRSLDAPWMEDDPDLLTPEVQKRVSSPVVSRPPDGGAVLLTLNQLLTFAEVVAKYGGPSEVWEKLRPDLPVWDHHDGEAVYLESAVDEFLRCRQPGTVADADIPTGDDAILSLEQAAKVVHVSPKTVLNWCAKDHVNCPRLKGGTFRRGDFLRWWTKTRRSKK